MNLFLSIVVGLDFLTLFIMQALTVIIFYGCIGMVYTAFESFKLAGRKQYRILTKRLIAMALVVFMVLQEPNMYLMSCALLITSFLCINATEALVFKVRRAGKKRGALTEAAIKLFVWWPLRFAWLIILAEIVIRLVLQDTSDQTMMAGLKVPLTSLL